MIFRSQYGFPLMFSSLRFAAQGGVTEGEGASGAA